MLENLIPKPNPAASAFPFQPTEPIHPTEPFQESPPKPPASPWKDALRAQFETWLDAIEEFPPPASSDDADLDSPPGLYAFYEQLAALAAENRKSNRRTAETFSQWGETLTHFESDLAQLREFLSRLPEPSEPTLPQGHCLALIEILDRMHRLLKAFESAPASAPAWGWGARQTDARWRHAWTTQQQGFDILVGHLQALLKKAGIEPIPVLGQIFDPERMIAVATDPHSAAPPQTVIEEITAGYSQGDQILRAAQVKISLPKAQNPL